MPNEPKDSDRTAFTRFKKLAKQVYSMSPPLCRGLAGAGVGMVVGWWTMLCHHNLHSSLSEETIFSLIVGFSLYCGILSIVLGHKFWKLLDHFLTYL